MAGQKGNKRHANKTSFTSESEKGNKNAAKCPKVVTRKFLKMLENANNDKNILCFQDACHSINWRDSKVAYWVNKLPIFKDLKKDVQSAIISRVNKEALFGDFNATASIWRMKQLGEKDQQYQEVKTTEVKESNLDNLSEEELIKLAELQQKASDKSK